MKLRREFFVFSLATRAFASTACLETMVTEEISKSDDDGGGGVIFSTEDRCGSVEVGESFTIELIEPYEAASNYVFADPYVDARKCEPANSRFVAKERFRVTFAEPFIAGSDCFGLTLETSPRQIDSAGAPPEEELDWLWYDRRPLGALTWEEEGVLSSVILDSPSGSPREKARGRAVPPLVLGVRRDIRLSSECDEFWVAEVVVP